jgi:hypothetical protein
MPNHIHFIVRRREDDPLKDVVRDFKANTARLIVRQYQVEGNEQALAFLVECTILLTGRASADSAERCAGAIDISALDGRQSIESGADCRPL